MRFSRVALCVAIGFIICIPVFLTSCSEPEWPAGLPHGEIVLPNVEDPDQPGAYFDFSEGEIVFGDEARERGDIYIERTFITGNAQLGVSLHLDQPDSILYDRSAPGWGDGEWSHADGDSPARATIRDKYNIWVVTGEGHTAKLKILAVESNADYTSFNRLTLQWIYQPDGSTSLTAGEGAGQNGESGDTDTTGS